MIRKFRRQTLPLEVLRFIQGSAYTYLLCQGDYSLVASLVVVALVWEFLFYVFCTGD